MRREVGLVIGVVLAGSMLVGAEERPAAEDDDAQPRTTTEQTQHKTLQDPHQISSFYRSSQSSPFDVDGYDGEAADSRYPIAGFYRQGGGSDRYPVAGYYRQDGGSDGRYPLASFYRQDHGSSKYPIAGFYRQGAQGRYGRFWSVPLRGRRMYGGVLLRPLGARELCAVAPTVLLPFAPFVNDAR